MDKPRKTPKCWCGKPATMFVTVPSFEHLCDDDYAHWYKEHVEASPDAAYLGEAYSHIPAPRRER